MSSSALRIRSCMDLRPYSKTGSIVSTGSAYRAEICPLSIVYVSKRMIELEVIPACREYGLGLVPWSPLAGGLLAGVLEKTNVGRRAHMSEIIENHRPLLEAYETLYHQLGEKPANVALA